MEIDIESLVEDPEGDIDWASLVVSSGPLFGSILLNQRSIITYEPAKDFYGTDIFVYSICDFGFPRSCCSEPNTTVVISVINQTSPVTSIGSSTSATLPNNSPLQCQNDIFSVSTTVDHPVEVDLLSLVLDSDGDIDVSSLAITSGPLFGTVSLHQGQVTYEPPPGFTGTDLFIYVICDFGVPRSCCGEPSSTVVIYVINSTTPAPTNFGSVSSTGLVSYSL